MKSKLHLAVLLTLLAIGLGVALYLFDRPKLQLAPAAPFVRLDGSQGNVSQFKGKVLLVNFWATSCPVCMQEMPQLVALHQRYKDRGFSTLAVAMSYDPPVNVFRYAEANKLPFDIVLDLSDDIARDFGNIEATPTGVLINRQGEIVARFVGKPNMPALSQLVQDLLAEPPVAAAPAVTSPVGS